MTISSVPTSLSPFTDSNLKARDTLQSALDQAYALMLIGTTALSDSSGEWRPEIIESYMSTIQGCIEQARSIAHSI